MRILLDTNRYGDMVARDQDVTERVQNASAVWLSFITIGELRSGFYRGSKRDRNESRLQAVLELQGVGLLSIDDETTKRYAEIIADLRSRGSMIPTNDVWIAAQALQHNLILDTRDEHFKKVRGLKLIDT